VAAISVGGCCGAPCCCSGAGAGTGLCWGAVTSAVSLFTQVSMRVAAFVTCHGTWPEMIAHVGLRVPAMAAE